MPRGGRRRGAGAPRGNFNGVTTGNSSARMLLIYLKLVALTNPNDPTITGERALLKQTFIESGHFLLPGGHFDGDTKGLCAFLWHEWFDSPASTQSNAIKDPPIAIKDPPGIPRPGARNRRKQIQIRAKHRRLLREAKNFLDLK